MTRHTADQVADALARRFNAHVEVDEVRSGRFRFDVYSKHFGAASHLERQDQAWAVVDDLLSREQSDDISILLTVGPEEVDAEIVAAMP